MKTLLVFCDGTGMDGTLAPHARDPALDKASAIQIQAVQESSQVASDVEKNMNQPIVSGGDEEPLSGRGDAAGGTTQHGTNVLRLARSVNLLDAKGNKQVVFYQSGVGSESNFKGDQVTGTTAMQALGTAVASKIRDAYVFLAQNFEDGDQICLFGFSRGAYTARKLASLIDRIGLLTRKDLGFFFKIWDQLTKKEEPTIPPETRHPHIECVGVWDTVGAIYAEIDALNLGDTHLPKTVGVALHAISIQENRKMFLPTLWSPPKEGLAPGQVLKQVWFSGAHSDVGGGYERHELADLSLFWMAGEVKSFINLDLDFLRSRGQKEPEPWGESQPHNAWKESKISMIVGHTTRLESQQIDKESLFHESVKRSPQQLTSPDYMTTFTLIQKQLGSGFVPKYESLNEFEVLCRDKWGQGTDRGPILGDEGPEIVIPPTVQWIRRESGPIPCDTIVEGLSGGATIYVARAPYDGGLYPGLLRSDTAEMFITQNGKKISIRDERYELLRGYKTHWVPVSGKFSFEKLSDAVPVRGGRDVDGEPLFVAGSKGKDLCGRVKVNELAQFPGDDSEIILEEYTVLVFV